MRKLYFIVFAFSFVCLSFLSSCEEGIVEPVRLLELYVSDTLGQPVPNATVELYLSERDFNTSTNEVIETFYTDEEGVVKVALDVDVFDYYVNVEKEERNNWYTNTFISLPNLNQKNTVVIVINNSFESKLTGRHKKRWQQTENIINGNPSFPNCSNQLYHDFIRRADRDSENRDGELEKYQANLCPIPGTFEGLNQWVYEPQDNTITLGIGNFAETYRVAEFTGNEMSLVYTTPDGAFVIERKYKFIE